MPGYPINHQSTEQMSYCQFVQTIEHDQNVHKIYHDQHYGFPINDDNELFGRLILEINQAGLSWETILKKQENFRIAYDQFDIQRVAAYEADDKARLLSDAGIIRNRLKVNAAVENAKVINGLQQSHGSFKNWLDAHHPRPKEEWTKLFKKTFKFTGGEIVNEFLMSTGYLPGAHDLNCPIYEKISAEGPRWKI